MSWKKENKVQLRQKPLKPQKWEPAEQCVLGLAGQGRVGTSCAVFCRKLLGTARDGWGDLSTPIRLVIKAAGHVCIQSIPEAPPTRLAGGSDRGILFVPGGSRL